MSETRQVESSKAIIATSNHLAQEAGAEMLAKGGNAVDAAIAACLCLCVVSPHHTGVAGYGGSMVVHMASTKETLAIDHNGEAPAAAREDMFKCTPTQEREGINPREYHCQVEGNANVLGPLAVSVPGVLAGLAAASERWGRLPWADLVRPAIRLAAEGFPISPSAGPTLRTVAKQHQEFPELAAKWGLSDGREPADGEQIACPDLARSLERIAEEGAGIFYQGWMGRRISDYVREKGGILSAQDMADYRARFEEPLWIRYRGYDLCTPGLASGGLSVLEMLKILERFDLSGMSFDDPNYVRLFAETARVAWHDRLLYFGDPGFFPVDQQVFISEQHADALAEKVSRALKEPPVGSVPCEPSDGTIHVSVIDAERNVVSITQTHGGFYGSKLTVPDLGITLGHGMCRFDPRPGRANSVAPRKRMLNNMAPLLVFKDGKPVASLGAPGGRTIISTCVHLAVGLIDFRLPIGEVLVAPRCHVEAGGCIDLSKSHSEACLKRLKEMGCKARYAGFVGPMAAGVMVDEGSGRLYGANGPDCVGLPRAV